MVMDKVVQGLLFTSQLQAWVSSLDQFYVKKWHSLYIGKTFVGGGPN